MVITFIDHIIFIILTLKKNGTMITRIRAMMASYSDKNEEEERAKIYDENMQYLDYIYLPSITKKQYNAIVKGIKNVKSIQELIEERFGVQSYDCSQNLSDLLYSIFDGEEDIREMERDLMFLSEEEVLEKYAINKIGDYYFYLGDY